MSKRTQRLIGSKYMIAKMNIILEACTKAKTNLEKVHSNRDKLSITDLIDAIEQQMIPLSALYDTIMGVDLVGLDAPSPEPTKTITLESHKLDVKKVTPKVLIKEALKKKDGQYLSFIMGEDFELDNASWFGFQIVELFDAKHLVLSHFGGGVKETICIADGNEEQVIEEMKEAVALLQKDEGKAIWMEIC